MPFRIIYFFLILTFTTKSSSQVALETLDDLKNYLEGEWQVTYHNNGWTGSTIYPTDSLDFRFTFEVVADQDSLLVCTGFLNEELIQTRNVNISNNETFKWGLSDLPNIFGHEWFTFYMYSLSITPDSFAIHDASFDGNTLKLLKMSPTSISEPHETTPYLKIYPNPADDHVTIEEIGSAAIKSIQLYGMDGRLLREDRFFSGSTLALQSIQGSFVIEVIMENGGKYREIVFRR